MSQHQLAQTIALADGAINREDFAALMNFYADDATLVVRPGRNATGKEQIRRAFEGIAEYFGHSLKVRQGEMVIVEGGDTALVLAQTFLKACHDNGKEFAAERHATYIFRRTEPEGWLCVVDNSYGTELLPVEHSAKLYLVCGKAGAGKSTFARQLAARPGTILIEEDEWLARMYPGEIRELSDYVRCTARVRDVLGGHIIALLKQGLSVMLDFPANTPAYRKWARALFEQAGVSHELHYLDVADDTCKARLRERNASGNHPFSVSEEAFDEVTAYFAPPAPEEGFMLIRHEQFAQHGTATNR